MRTPWPQLSHLVRNNSPGATQNPAQLETARKTFAHLGRRLGAQKQHMNYEYNKNGVFKLMMQFLHQVKFLKPGPPPPLSILGPPTSRSARVGL